MCFLTYRLVYKNQDKVENIQLSFLDVLLLLFYQQLLKKWQACSQMEKGESWTTNASFQIEQEEELLWNQVILSYGVLSIRTGPKNNR